MFMKLFSIVSFFAIGTYAQAQVDAPSDAFKHFSIQYLIISSSYIEFVSRSVIQPNQELLRRTNLIGIASPLNSVEQNALDNLAAAYTKLDKVKMAVLNFWDFYKESYPNYEGDERLSPKELFHLIERLSWFDNYFDLLKKRRFLKKMLTAGEIEQLEILEMKNSILKMRLSMEIRRIFRANIDDPVKMKRLFSDIDLSKVATTSQALEIINLKLTRLEYLEAQAKSCLALF